MTESQGPENPVVEVTPEVLAFARAVIAAHEAAQPQREPRYLFNLRSGTIHNPGCQAQRWAVPMTMAEIAANRKNRLPVIDCMACGSFESPGLQPYDTVEVAP